MDTSALSLESQPYPICSSSNGTQMYNGDHGQTFFSSSPHVSIQETFVMFKM
jgi:hypothetical protein